MPTDDRFWLRFESGDRRGERVAIPAAGLSIGRRAGSDLTLADPSVSARHAELSVADDGVHVRDLGSTNGTRVGSERVLEHTMLHGEVLSFGSVRFTFLDDEGAEVELEESAAVAPPPAAKPRARAVEPAADELEGEAPAEVERVSAEALARARGQGSGGAGARWIAIGAVVLLVGGAAAAYFLLGSKSADVTPVASVPGDLLGESGAFEGDRDPWEAFEGAPSAFLLSQAARSTGAQGLRVELAPGEWAAHRSPPFAAHAGREVRARATLHAKHGVEARLGVEFQPAEEDGSGPATVQAWSAPSAAEGAAGTEIAIAAAVPPGYARARLVLLARAGPDGGGSVDADDASAVEAGAAGAAAAAAGGAELHLYGDPPIAAQLSRAGHALVSGIELAPAGSPLSPGMAEPARGIALTAKSDGPRIVLGAALTSGGELALRAEEPLARGGIATIGAEGYRTHGVTTSREGVTSILLGSGRDLVEVELPGPCKVSGERDGSGVRLVAQLGDARAEPRAAQTEIALQLDFTAERGAAEDLAHAARAAEKRGELGAAVARWGELLDRHPYEQALVVEAESTRAKLNEQGFAGLRDVRAAGERARAFALAPMFTSARERALAIAARFEGSDVAVEAKKLADELGGEAQACAKDENAAERARLQAIGAVLDARGAADLARRVREELALLEGGG